MNNTRSPEPAETQNHDHLIKSTDSQHPANLICTLCEKFYHLGWVAGTGGGTSIRDKYVQISRTKMIECSSSQVIWST